MKYDKEEMLNIHFNEKKNSHRSTLFSIKSYIYTGELNILLLTS